MLGLCLVLFIVMLFFAFLPGWQEMKRKKDNKNMYINNDYVKDPEYFAKSFKQMLTKQVKDLSTVEDGRQLRLSKPEIINCPAVNNNTVGGSYNNITLFKEAVSILPESQFNKETIFLKQVKIGQGSLLRAGLCLKDCLLASEVQIVRWLDAENLVAGENCDLGMSATARKALILVTGCKFKRLYASVIEVGTNTLPSAAVLPANFLKPRYDVFLEEDKNTEENKVYDVNIVKRHGDLSIQPGATVTGSIKGYGKITIASGATVLGNVFGEQDIIIEAGAKVLGDVFANGFVELGAGSSIGQAGKCKSLVTRDGIKLHQPSRIYGYVSTDGEGIVL